MNTLLIIIGITLLIIGFIGSVAPVLPGPPIAFVSLLLLQFTSKQPFTTLFLILMAAIVVIVTILDYVIPTIGTKKFGGSSYGAWGCIIGTLAGLFMFPPLGIIIMPFVGAFIGEMIYDNNIQKAVRAAFGSFLGFLGGTLMKLIVCGLITVAFVWGLL